MSRRVSGSRCTVVGGSDEGVKVGAVEKLRHAVADSPRTMVDRKGTIRDFPFLFTQRWFLVDAASYRIFKSRPLPAFAEQVRAQIREHNQPELISELRHGPIARNEEFDILCEISIDPGKRPEQDLAPCPMCQPNKFIHGRLCYFPGLQCCAIIGHCCADKKQRDSAERKFRETSARDWQEEYFLNALPLIPQKLEIIAAVRPKAEEALRLHKKFHKDANRLMHLLRGIAKDNGGRLRVQFEVELKSAVNDKSSGIRFERLVDANDYGVLDGLVALRSKYDPVLELNAMETALTKGNVGTDDEAVINAIVAMEPKDREWTYTVLQRVDNQQWPRFQRKLEDFCSFFQHDNLQRLARWGQDPKNRDQVVVVDRMLRLGVRQIELAGAGARTALSPGSALDLGIPLWPAVPKAR